MAVMAPIMVQKFPVRPKTGSEPEEDITEKEPVVSEKIREYDMLHASFENGDQHGIEMRGQGIERKKVVVNEVGCAGILMGLRFQCLGCRGVWDGSWNASVMRKERSGATMAWARSAMIVGASIVEQEVDIEYDRGAFETGTVGAVTKAGRAEFGSRPDGQNRAEFGSRPDRQSQTLSSLGTGCARSFALSR